MHRAPPPQPAGHRRAAGRQASRDASSSASCPALRRVAFSFKRRCRVKNHKGGKSRRLRRCALRGPGPAAGPPARLLGLLDHTFTEVRHFGVFYFLLVQLILSPKEQFQ